MKRVRFIILSMLLLAFTYLSFASNPPDPGSSPQGSDPPLGGGAPVGSGVFILLGLGIAYGGNKLYRMKNNSMDEEP